MTYSIDYLTKHNRRKIRSIFACPVSEDKYKGKCLVHRGGAIIIRFIQEVGYEGASIIDGFYCWDFDFFRVYITVDEIKKNPELSFDGDRGLMPYIWLSVRRVILSGNNDVKIYKTPRIYIIHALENVRVDNHGTEEWEYIDKYICFPYLRYPKIHRRRFFKRIIIEKFGWNPKYIIVCPKVIEDTISHKTFPLMSPFDLETYKDVILSRPENKKDEEYCCNMTKDLEYSIINNELEYLNITQEDINAYVEEENNRKHKVVRYGRA